MWIDRLLSTEEGRSRLNEAVDELWPYALGVLDDELRPELRRRAEERLGRRLPDVEAVPRGVHEVELGSYKTPERVDFVARTLLGMSEPDPSRILSAGTMPYLPETPPPATSASSKGAEEATPE